MVDETVPPDPTGAVDAAFGEVRRLRAWLAFPLPADLRGELELRRAKAESELVGLLLAWQDLGGGVVLELPAAAADVPADETQVSREAQVEFPSVDAAQIQDSAPEPDDRTDVAAVVDTVITVPEPFVSSEEPSALVETAVAPAGVPAVPLESEVVAPVQPVGDPPDATPTIAPENKRLVPPIISSPPVDTAAAELLKRRWASGGALAVIEPAPAPPKFNFKQALEVAKTPGFEAAMALSANLARWDRLPQAHQNLLLELAAARLRIVQPKHEKEVVRRIQQLSRWSTATRTGLVNGLNHGARPKGGSWAVDVENLVQRLAEVVAKMERPAITTDEQRIRGIEVLLAEYITAVESADEPAADQAEANLLGAIKQAYASGTQRKHPKLVHLFRPHPFLLGGSEFKDLRRAIRDLDETDDDKASPAGNRLEPTWPHFHHTRGKRGLLVGGDPRDDRRERLKQAFQFASLEWAQTEFSRTSLQSARTRIESGGVDVVMVLHRWCGHDVDKIIQPACKKHGVAFVPVQQSYGITGIRMAFERFGESSAHRADAAK